GLVVSVGSNALDRHVVGVGSQRLQVSGIRRQHGAARLGASDDQGIDGGAPAGAPAKERRSSSQRLWERLFDLAGLEKPVGVRVSSGISLQALGQDDRRDLRWPEFLLAQGNDERQ